MRVQSLALVLVATLLAAGPVRAATAVELIAKPWIEVRSTNFVVYSMLDEKVTRKLVQDLEDFRYLVVRFTTAGRVEPRVPTLLYFFSDPVQDIGLDGTVAGYFTDTMRGNYAAVREVWGMPSIHVIQHEYVHFVARNQNSYTYPRWYSEGIAEVLATATLNGGTFEIGRVAWERLGDMHWTSGVPYAQVIDDEQVGKQLSPDANRKFYVQSALLVHYLIWGRPGVQFQVQLQNYLDSRRQGKAARPAFEDAFGEDLKSLDRRMRSYSTKLPYWRGNFANSRPDTPATVRTMATDEVAAALGVLCLATEHSDKALPYFAAALVANPRNTAALAGRAALYKLEGRFVDAESLYAAAIAADPERDLPYLEFGEYWLDRAKSAGGEADRQQFLTLARQNFVKAHKRNDQNPETLVMYGSSFMLPGEDPAKGLDTLKLANQLLPSNKQAVLALAGAYKQLGRPAEALPLLQAVRAWSHSDDAQALDELIAEVQGTLADATTPNAGDRPVQ